MHYDERLQQALASRIENGSLHGLARQLLSEGQTKDQVLGLFERFLLEIRKLPEVREADEDAILDVMDTLTGWCRSDNAI